MSETMLRIIDPWTMPYSEYEQQFIDELECEITSKHPLYRKELCVIAVRRNPTAVIFETDSDNPIYALVYLRQLSRNNRKVDPKTRIFKDEATINYPIGNNRMDRRLFFVNPAEWPEIPTEIHEPSIPVDDTLKEAIQNAFDCSCQDSARFILQSAFLDARDPKANYVVGSDGRVLFSANSFQFGLRESLIIPNRKFLHWRGFLDDTNCQLSSLAPVIAVPATKGKEKVDERPGYVQFKSDRWTFITRHIAGEYPNWKNVLPSRFNTLVHLPKESVQFIMSAVPKMPCPDSITEGIQLVVKDGTLSLSSIAAGDTDWTTLLVPGAEVDGDAVTVAMNRNFLMRALEFGLDELGINDELSPVVFRKDGRRMVISCIRREAVEPTTPETAPENTPATAPKEPAVASSPAPTAPVAPAIESPDAKDKVNDTASTAAPNAALTAAIQPEERTSSMPEQVTHQETKSTRTDKCAKPQSAYDQLQDMVEGIRASLKGVATDLNELSKTVAQAYREKRATDKEIESIRGSLNEIRKMKI